MSDKNLAQSDDPQDRRDDLIEKLYRGEVSLSEAKNEARELGLGPLEKTADPSTFDPMAELSWTPLMAVAWIVFRDPERVRWVTDEYRMKCTHFEPITKGEKTTFHIVTYSAANRYTLDTTYTSYVAARHTDMTVDEATQLLIQALKKGSIEATGIRQPETERSRIPSMQWEDLRFFLDDHSDIVGGTAARWHKVRLKRDGIEKLWPERPSEPEDSVAPGSAEASKVVGRVRTRGRSPGDKALRAKEIQAVLSAAKNEYDPSDDPGLPSYAKMAKHLETLPAVKDTRYKQKSTIAKILSGALPAMAELDIKSPYCKRE